MAWVMGTLVAVTVASVVMTTRLWHRVQRLEAAGARVNRLGEAVTLLSETAEAGFATVAMEIERLQRAPVTRTAGTRTTVARRVVRAAARGESVEHIARREALSEGEVRLHLALAESGAVLKKGTRHAGLRA